MAVSPLQAVIGILVAAIAILITTFVVPRENVLTSIFDKSERISHEDGVRERIVLKTRNGILQGVKEFTVRNPRTIYSFKGIPYAEPPINELRFKDPVAVKPWSGTKGGKTPPQCPQYSIHALMAGKIKMIGQEDCLYLNVYTPEPHASDLPVMVYIHGGGFTFGDADIFGGTPQFLLARDVILVSMQYRLGTLGFLSMEDSVLPGNLGMKDQILALKWVQENIRKFGGNPNKVTIFGQSAGAASVHLHLMSPNSEGLFHRAILQSGNALAPYAVRNDHKIIADQVREMLKCPGTDSANFFRCLQAAPIENLTLSAIKLTKFSRYPLYMVPRVDGDFLPEHPAVLLKEGRYHKVNLMSGLTTNEGAFTAIAILNNDAMREDLFERFDVAGPVLCGIENEESADHLARKIFYHHMDKIEITEDNADELAEIVSESFYNRGHDDSVMIHAKDSSKSATKVFIYEFEHRGKRPFIDAFQIRSDSNYVMHGDELLYLFNDVLGVPSSNEQTDLLVSNVMVELWTNFALTGNPTPDLSLGFKWHPVTEDLFLHLAIRSSPALRNDRRAKKREFWRSLPLATNKLLFPEKFKQEESLTEP